MRILGIDPGLRTTGFGVIDKNGSRLIYVASGTIATTHLETGNLPARLKVLFEGIKEVVQRYEPDESSVEIVFVNVRKPRYYWAKRVAHVYPPWYLMIYPCLNTQHYR
jgi:crossover junction endodeoxyribonuclease RuvC